MRSTVFLVAFSTLSVLACGSDTPTENGPPSVASVVVTPGNATVVSFGETVQLTASARDADGNTISGKTFTWSSADQNIATVNGSGLVTAVANGSATITATTDGINGAAMVDVSQVATQLVFTVQPTDAVVAAPVTPPIQVAIQDALGNTVTGATEAVNLAIGTNPGGGTPTGSVTGFPQSGVARFSNLLFDRRGVGYTLVASSADLSSTTSASFDITPLVVTGTVTVPTAMASDPVLIGEIEPLPTILAPFSNSGDTVTAIFDGATVSSMVTLAGGPTSRIYTDTLPDDPRPFGTLVAWLDQNQNGLLDFPAEPARFALKEIEGSVCAISFWGFISISGRAPFYTVSCDGVSFIWNIFDPPVGTTGFDFRF